MNCYITYHFTSILVVVTVILMLLGRSLVNLQSVPVYFFNLKLKI